MSSGRLYAGQCNNRTGTAERQNTNFLIYTFPVEVNILEFNPAYPKNPQNLGQQIRKARMDKGLMIKELAEKVGVTEDTVINWEIRGMQPQGKSMERVSEFIENNALF